MEKDFDPYGGCLDAQTAWRNFGGLSLDEAYTLFCKNTHYYAEDFMWMGHVAFAFYFPVVERCVQNGEDHDLGFIGIAINFQFQQKETSKIDHLRPRVLTLAKFVIQELGQSDESWANLSELSPE